ncbi:fibronectin type III domain-containing protein [Maribacter sp. TH_r10]|uniref:fibronectin type III domain-containing protein n=1 Tax=Maribacter sp. TH_r10 TaxID=3082086 RepID=UPI002953C912|nr:fibronectin type III domain-containing protein [Maribacter sp. TH_r10]MDV7137911.1 fibronectin type III domain-containing protein [Maribacter sp. TH_r10]
MINKVVKHIINQLHTANSALHTAYCILHTTNRTLHTATCLLILAFTITSATAQNFPVQVIPQAIPPAPIHFSDYADASTVSSPLRVQIILNDLEIANREVRLKAHFQGNGITFQSNDIVVGADPLFLEGGVPLILTNVELAPYFQFQNITGISPNVYGQTIPEGAYQFCFEVYDVLSGNRLSNKSCATTVVFQNEPPFLVMPRDKTNIEEINPQSIVFQWTPRSINVTNVEYELSLVEIWDTQIDPQAAFLSSPPVFQTTTTATTYVYGPVDPLLLSGKNYAWRVQARAKQGIEEIGLFKNEGYSEIFSFSYAGSCDLPLSLNHEVKGSTNANIFWDDFTTDIPEYTVRYRKKGNDNEWFLSKTTTNQLTLWDLKAGTTYEYQIQKKCTVTGSDWSLAKEFTTPLEFEEESVIDCGITPDINLTNTEPLANISTGTSFKAGDFPVKITEVSGSNGRFTGKGYVSLPYLKNIKVAVEFTNILINTDQEMAEGTVNTVYDPTWKNMLSVDSVLDVAEDITDEFTGGDENVTYSTSFEILSTENIKKENGKIVVTGPNVETTTFDYDEGDSYEISDANGNTFNIDKEGNITTGEKGAEGGASTAESTDGISEGSGTAADPSVSSISATGITVHFEASKNTKYGLDKVDEDSAYEKANYPKATTTDGSIYYPIHKAVVEGKTDEFLAIVENNNPEIDLDSLQFKTVKGTQIKSARNGDTFTITVTGSNSYHSDEAVVTYKGKDGKYKIIASFFIHHIKQHGVIDVVLVAVNGSSQIPDLEKQLNEIYGKAGATFKVTTKALTLDQNDWDDNGNKILDYDGSGLMSDYPQELKNIQQKYKDDNKDWNRSAYHLFLLPSDIPLGKALSGFMPKTRQWGYVFGAHTADALEDKSSQSLVAAHELGHGVFALPHPFQNDENKSGSGTDWLMDYGGGDQLSYTNWAAMSDESLQLFLFQDEEDSEIAGKIWFTPDWKPFSLDVETSSEIIAIALGEEYQGAIPGFRTKNDIRYQAQIKDGEFNGYFDSNEEEFKIDSETPEDDSLVNFFVYGGCYDNKRLTYTYSKNLKTYTDYQNKGTLIDTYNYPCTNKCYYGQQFYDEYITTIRDDSEKESLNALVKLICENGKDYYNALVSQIEKLNKEEKNSLIWKNYKYIYESLSDSFWTQEDAWQKYASTLIKIKEIFQENTDLQNVNTADLFFILGYSSHDLLATLSVKEKVEILQYLLTNEFFINEGNWLNIFKPTANKEGLIIKLINSISEDQGKEFFDEIQNYTVGGKSVFSELFSRINNVGGSEQFTALNLIMFAKLIESEGGLDNYINKYKDLEVKFKWYQEDTFKYFIESDLRYRSEMLDNGQVTFVGDFKINYYGDNVITYFDCTTDNCNNIWETIDESGHGFYDFKNFVSFQSLDPYDVILIEFTSEIPELNIPKGTFLPVPAFLFHTIVLNHNWEIIKENISDFTMIASTLFAGGALLKGVKGIERGLAVYTFYTNIGEYILKDNLIKWLESTDDGRFVLKTYRLGNTLLSVGTIVNSLGKPVELESIIDSMSVALDLQSRFGQSFVSKFPTQYKQLIEELNKLR